MDPKSLPKLSGRGMRPYRDLQNLHDDIVEMVYSKADQVSLAETLGVLELVKRTLMEAQ